MACFGCTDVSTAAIEFSKSQTRWFARGDRFFDQFDLRSDFKICDLRFISCISSKTAKVSSNKPSHNEHKNAFGYNYLNQAIFFINLYELGMASIILHPNVTFKIENGLSM